jgi:hypothetical protein
MNALFDGWSPWHGAIQARSNGAMVADREGVATPYAVFHLQERGIIFIPPGARVYEGMVVGEYSRDVDLNVNICREKKLTNIRAAGRDENIIISRTGDGAGRGRGSPTTSGGSTPESIRLAQKSSSNPIVPDGGTKKKTNAGKPPSLLRRFVGTARRAFDEHHIEIPRRDSNFNCRTAARLVLFNFGFMARRTHLFDQLVGTLDILKLGPLLCQRR